jgi:hypothetical protein
MNLDVDVGEHVRASSQRLRLRHEHSRLLLQTRLAQGFMLFRNSADHVEQILVLLVVQGPEIILIYVEARSPPAPFGRVGIFRIESPARGEPKRERRAQTPPRQE